MPVVGIPSAPTGGSAVPTDGTFASSSWVEVFDTHHDFTGRTILTNGLLLLDSSVGSTFLATVYLWSTGLATPAWQQCFNLAYFDNAGNQGTLRQISVIRVGQEESAVSLISQSSGNQIAQHVIRLQRGRYEGRVDFKPLTQATTSVKSLLLNHPAVPKILYNSTNIADNVLSETSPVFSTDYGYGAAFIANATYPFLTGFLYQNEPVTQPNTTGGNVTNIGLGDSTSLAQNTQRSYGFFAAPYGVNASYSPANLQAEAESGTLGTGWSSVADAAASAGNTAKVASGTLSGNADTFGTAFVPAPGTYDVWFRVRVTTNVGSNAEMTLGLWDSTSAAFVPSGSTTFNRTAASTSYAWMRAATAVTPTAGHNMRFQAVTALTLGTDWFIDEAVMVPKTLTAANTGPQDIWQQFAFDRSTKLIRG